MNNIYVEELTTALSERPKTGNWGKKAKYSGKGKTKVCDRVDRWFWCYFNFKDIKYIHNNYNKKSFSIAILLPYFNMYLS